MCTRVVDLGAEGAHAQEVLWPSLNQVVSNGADSFSSLSAAGKLLRECVCLGISSWHVEFFSQLFLSLFHFNVDLHQV